MRPYASADVEFQRQQQIIKTRILPNLDVTCSVEELAYFSAAEKIVELFKGVKLESTRRDLKYPDLEFRLAHQKSGSFGFLEIRADMHCSGLDVIAKRFDYHDFTSVKVVEILSDRSFVGLLDVAAPLPLLPRQFICIMVWRKIDINTASLAMSRRPDSATAIYQIIAMPTTHSSVPETSTTVRGLLVEVTYVYQHSTTDTEYVTYAHADPRGNVPAFLVNLSIVDNNAPRVRKLSEVFLRRLILDDLDERLSVAFGNTFLHAKRQARKGTSAAEVVEFVIDKHASLSQAAALYPALRSVVLAAVLENKLRRVPECKTKLLNLTTAEGSAIGGALAASLLYATSPASGVAEWIGIFPALTEMKEKYVWAVRADDRCDGNAVAKGKQLGLGCKTGLRRCSHSDGCHHRYHHDRQVLSQTALLSVFRFRGREKQQANRETKKK